MSSKNGKTATVVTPVETEIVKPLATSTEAAEAAEDKAAEAAKVTAMLDSIAEAAEAASQAAEAAEAFSYKSKAKRAIAEAAKIAESLAEMVSAYRHETDLSKLVRAVETAESLATKAIEAAEAAENAKVTESEQYSALALASDLPLVHHGDEKYVSSAQVCILRYTRNTENGYVSVLFYSPLQGNAIKPIGLISQNGIKRFSDVPMSDLIQACISKAESSYCDGLKEQRKHDRLSAKLDKVSEAFGSGSVFRRI